MLALSGVAAVPLGCQSGGLGGGLKCCGNHLRGQNGGLHRRLASRFRRERHPQHLNQCGVVSASHQDKESIESFEMRQEDVFGRRAALSLLVGLCAASGLGGKPVDRALAAGPDEIKRKNVPIEEIKEIIAGDIADRHYFITGQLTTDIFSENCRFKDPTNDTTGLRKYLDVVSILFDPATSSHELLSIEINGPNTILAKWRLGGYLQFPWRPRVLPFEGSTLYTVGDEGLIVSHEEKWSITPITALIETLTPSWMPSLL